MAMGEEHRIRNMRDATEAFARANRTMEAVTTLLKEANSPGVSEHERADKKREADRLRRQQQREVEPVEAFYDGLADDGGRALLRELWQTGRQAGVKKKQVVEAVRAVGHGKTRGQLWTLFEEEMDRHGVPRNPIWVEQKLDELEWSPGDRGRETLRRLGLAGVTLGRMVQSHGLPDAPQWMEPPPDATYRVPAGLSEKTAVDLDPEAGAWLDRALVSTPRRVGTLLAIVDVWFSHDAASDDGGHVIVHLGVQRVGTLNEAASERFAPVMKTAASRDAKPRATAQLAEAMHRRPPYMLVADVPLPDKAPTAPG